MLTNLGYVLFSPTHHRIEEPLRYVYEKRGIEMKKKPLLHMVTQPCQAEDKGSLLETEHEHMSDL